jgi:MFS family permease
MLGITATGALVTVPRVASAVAVLAGGMLFDRFAHLPLRRLVVPPLVVSGIFLAGTTLVDGAAPFVTLLTLSMAAQGLAVMPVFGLPLRLVPIGYIGTVISLINCGAQLGGSISPYVMGLLVARFSFSVAFGFLNARKLPGQRRDSRSDAHQDSRELWGYLLVGLGLPKLRPGANENVVAGQPRRRGGSSSSVALVTVARPGLV